MHACIYTYISPSPNAFFFLSMSFSLSFYFFASFSFDLSTRLPSFPIRTIREITHRYSVIFFFFKPKNPVVVTAASGTMKSQYL